MTKEQKLELYRKSLENLEKNIHTSCGLCYLLQKTNQFRIIDVDMYAHLEMKIENGVFIEAELKGFEEITNQAIGLIHCGGGYWFPKREWESRKQILLNAITILENESTN